jgi:hypothetical protein
MSVPTKQCDVRSFLEHARYYRRFIQNFSKLVSSLFVLISKDVECIWASSCEQAFGALKEKITYAIVLQGSNWKLPFHIYIDAFDKSLGAIC